MTALLRRPRLSAPARPDISCTYQWEPFDRLLPELRPLLRLAADEMDDFKDRLPLDPDWGRYLGLFRSGIVQVWTARAASGVLVGFAILFVLPNLHYRTVHCARTDLFWLSPAWRSGWIGVKLFATLIRELRERDVKVFEASIKMHWQHARMSRLFARLGFKPSETVQAIWLGD